MPRNRFRILIAAALAAGCAADRELRGAAAARSRGAEVPGPGAIAAPGTVPGPVRPADPWLDDAFVKAKVNGQVITIGQVRHELGPMYDQNLDRRPALTVLVNNKVRELVLRRLVADEGRRVGVSVNDDDMRRHEELEEKEAKARGDTIEQNIRDRGMTRREWDENLREDILYQRSHLYFMGRFPDFAYDEDRFRPCVESWVSPVEVRAWGERHRADIDRPGTAAVRILYLCAEDFGGPGVGVDEAWRRCSAAFDALEERLRAGESFAAVADLGRRFPGAGEGGLHPPVTRDSGDLQSQYREWAFAPERKEGDASGRMKVPPGFVVLFLEKRETAVSPDIEEWGPFAYAQIEARRRILAWTEVQVRLLEEGAVSPADLRASLLAELRAEAKKIRRELEPPDGERTAAAPVR